MRSAQAAPSTSRIWRRCRSHRGQPSACDRIAATDHRGGAAGHRSGSPVARRTVWIACRGSPRDCGRIVQRPSCGRAGWRRHGIDSFPDPTHRGRGSAPAPFVADERPDGAGWEGDGARIALGLAQRDDGRAVLAAFVADMGNRLQRVEPRGENLAHGDVRDHPSPHPRAPRRGPCRPRWSTSSEYDECGGSPVERRRPRVTDFVVADARRSFGGAERGVASSAARPCSRDCRTAGRGSAPILPPAQGSRLAAAISADLRPISRDPDSRRRSAADDPHLDRPRSSLRIRTLSNRATWMPGGKHAGPQGDGPGSSRPHRAAGRSGAGRRRCRRRRRAAVLPVRPSSSARDRVCFADGHPCAAARSAALRCRLPEGRGRQRRAHPPRRARPRGVDCACDDRAGPRRDPTGRSCQPVRPRRIRSSVAPVAGPPTRPMRALPGEPLDRQGHHRPRSVRSPARGKGPRTASRATPPATVRRVRDSRPCPLPARGATTAVPRRSWHELRPLPDCGVARRDRRRAPGQARRTTACPAASRP